jgi:hemin uptake protein HemP
VSAWGSDRAARGAETPAGRREGEFGVRHPAPTPSSRRWSSAEILAGSPEVFIEHHGEVYRLRRTRRGRLILTK